MIAALTISPDSAFRELDMRPATVKSSRTDDALAANPLFRDRLGDEVVREFITIKEMEWIEYQRHVSDWEIERYLEYY